jgi:hypothetical protein
MLPKTNLVLCQKNQLWRQFFIRQCIKRCTKQKKDIHIIFIDMENIYDKLTRNIM